MDTAGPIGFQHIETAPKEKYVRLRFRPGLLRPEDREEIGIWLARPEMPAGGSWFDEDGNYITPGPLFWAPYVREGYTFYTGFRP